MKTESKLSDMCYGLGERDELAFNQADADFYDKLLDRFKLSRRKPVVKIGGDHFHRNLERSNLFEDITYKADLSPLFQSDVHISQYYERYAMNTEDDIKPLILHPSNDAVEKWRETSRLFYEQVMKRAADSPNDVTTIDSYPSFLNCGGRRVGRSFVNELVEEWKEEYIRRFEVMSTPELRVLRMVINARLNAKSRKAYTKVKEPNVWHYVGTDPGSSKSIYELHGIATSIALMQSLIDEIVGVDNEP